MVRILANIYGDQAGRATPTPGTERQLTLGITKYPSLAEKTRKPMKGMRAYHEQCQAVYATR
jgi:hypothetical protein